MPSQITGYSSSGTSITGKNYGAVQQYTDSGTGARIHDYNSTGEEYDVDSQTHNDSGEFTVSSVTMTEEEIENLFDMVSNYDADIEDLLSQIAELNAEISAKEVEIENAIGPAGFYDTPEAQEMYQARLNAMTEEQIAPLKEQVEMLSANLAVLKNIRDAVFSTAYFSYMQMDDFATNSATFGRIGSFNYEYEETAVGLYGESYGNNNLYFYDSDGNQINNISPLDAAIYCYENGVSINDGNGIPSNYGYQWYIDVGTYSDLISHMTTEEISILNYLSNTGDSEKYDDYLDFVLDLCNQRIGMADAQEVVDKINSYYETLPEADAYAATLALLAKEGFVDGLSNFADGLMNLFYADGKMSANQYASMYILQSLQNRFSDQQFLELIAQGTYEISNSMGNMAPTMVISMIPGCQGIGLALMGASSAGNAREQGLQSGMSDLSAWIYGILSGASEAALEYFLGAIPGLSDMEKFADLPGFTGFFMKMLSEGTEESLQSILEPFFQAMATGDVSGLLNPDIDWGEVIKSGIYGMITAGIMNGGQVVIDGAVYSIKTEQINSLLNEFSGKDLTNPEVNSQFLERLSNITGQPSNVDVRYSNDGSGILSTIYSGVTEQSVSDLEYCIDKWIEKYGGTRESALAQIESIISNHDYNRMTRYGGARDILSKYSFSELDTILAKLKMRNGNVNTTGIQIKPALINSSDDFFSQNQQLYGVSYGIDQGIIYDMFVFYDSRGNSYNYREAKEIVNSAMKNGDPIPRFKKVANEEYFALKDMMYEKYGLTYNESSIILSTIDDAGACSYAATCNEIFAAFKSRPDLFEQCFGFPMYKNVDGFLIPNYSELLVDMYVNINMVENGGRFLIRDGGSYVLNDSAFSGKIDPLGRRLLDADNQVFLSGGRGKNANAINNYLSLKGLKYYTNVVVGYSQTLNTSQMNQLINTVVDGINSGKEYSLGIYQGNKEIRMISMDPSSYSSVSTFNWSEGGGHAIFVTGINETGFIVSSWGQKYVIPFVDLLQNGAPWVLNESIISY